MSLALVGSDINFLAVVVSGIANILACLILYLPKLFGNAWERLTGKELKPALRWIPAGIAGHLVNALVLEIVLITFKATTIFEGISFAALVWIGFFVPLEAGELVWDKIPFKLFMIRVGILLVAECITGIILVVWR